MFGQLDQGLVSTELRRVFPTAIFVPCREIVTDFECLRRSKNIAVSVSTFSFLSAYLSDRSTNIYMPLYGLFNRIDRPDIDFVVDDSRFHYFDFPCIKWNADSSQIQEVITGRWDCPSGKAYMVKTRHTSMSLVFCVKR